MLNIINKGIQLIFVFMTAIILMLLCFFADSDYLCKITFLYSNITLLAGILILLFTSIAISIIVRKKCRRKIRLSYNKIVRISAIMLFLWQVYLSYNIYFHTGWDVSLVLDNAQAVAFGDSSLLSHAYFSQYPNNLFLVSLYALILKLNRGLGIFPGNQQLLSLILVNCMCSSLACFLIYKVLLRLLNERYAFIGFWLGAAAFGLSPWVTICYSDATGILFPILLFWLCLIPVRNRYFQILRYLAVILFGIIGYAIKPQAIIVLIALVGTGFFYQLNKKDRKELGTKGLALVLAFILAALAFKGLDKLYQKEGFVLNKEDSFGMTHFLMMGLNSDRNGVWAAEDVDFSLSFPTYKERQMGNLQIVKQRLKDFGVIGYGKHLAKKILVNYHDGTYAWGVEGGFFLEYYPEPNTRAAAFLRNIYYPSGKYHEQWKTASQTVWLLVLFLGFCAGTGNYSGENRKYASILFLSVIGLTAFVLLFEARARYLYTHIPIFCVIAVLGLETLHKKAFQISGICHLQKGEHK